MKGAPRINGSRLWQSTMDMAKIDALSGGGCGHHALTDGDRKARDLFRQMVSGAGHDACQVARKVAKSMVFVPCKDGLSDN
jgi:hypothetical protein